MTYKIFYNSDCCKYGIQNENGQQVLIRRHKGERSQDCFCYTKYRGVALRTLARLNEGQYSVFSY